jgi:hypothetical protein
MKVKAFLLVIFFSLVSHFATAQAYNTAIGLRLGPHYGITAKHHLTSQNALEGILTAGWNHFQLVGLYQVHNQAFQMETMRWYYGGGAHIGSWQGGRYLNQRNGFLLGASGILGLEYNFLDLPLNISLDWLPQIDIIERFGPRFDNFGVSVRYMIR